MSPFWAPLAPCGIALAILRTARSGFLFTLFLSIVLAFSAFAKRDLPSLARGVSPALLWRRAVARALLHAVERGEWCSSAYFICGVLCSCVTHLGYVCGVTRDHPLLRMDRVE